MGCSLALGLGLGLGFVGGSQFTKNPSSTKNFQSASSLRGIVSSTDSYAPAVKASQGAVVNVFSEKTKVRQKNIDLFFEDLLGGEEFFPMNRAEKSLGSGVLISADGYILTNSHVVNGADKVFVALADGKEIQAQLVGIDPKTDLALLKIKGNNFPFLTFADSDAAQIGDVVLAIGNPFGIGQTVTIGIVSAKKRENLGILDYEDFIQTDAAINPGNSGGALINSKGNLIGINTAIYSKSGGYQGIGFSVPANLAQKIAQELKENGKISRAYLGVAVLGLHEEMTPVTAYYLKKGYEEGALIIKVEADSPAFKAGMKAGSLITKVNNTQITVPEQLFKVVSQTPVNNSLQIEAEVLDLESGKITKDLYSVKPVIQ